MSRKKNNGEVFTPQEVVNKMIELSGYLIPEELGHPCVYAGLHTHVMDNCCGQGNILKEIVDYRLFSLNMYAGLQQFDEKTFAQTAVKELETYIHGIELDEYNYQECIKNLDNFVFEKVPSIKPGTIKWDIRNANALTVTDYDGMMDFTIINPPYVRVHNIDEENRKIMANYSFIGNGMEDTYIAFYELAFRQTKPQGLVCVISANSWLTSVAGTMMRKYIAEKTTFKVYADYCHHQPFDNATTYVSISCFKNEPCETGIQNTKIYEWSDEKNDLVATDKHFSIDKSGLFYIGEPVEKTSRKNHKIKVKNGYATLADKVFLTDKLELGTLDVIKASTGEQKIMWFPYVLDMEEGKLCPMPYDMMEDEFPEMCAALKADEETLRKRSIKDVDNTWWLYGRTQGLQDTFIDKFAVSSIVKDVNDMHIVRAYPGVGVYGGLYVTGEGLTMAMLEGVLRTPEFFEYIKSLRKYKNGGYYTFSSSDLEEYLNRHIEL